MENDKDISIEEINQLIDEHFLPVFNKKLDQHDVLLDAIYKLQNGFLKKLNPDIDEGQLKINQKIYKLELSKLISKYYHKPEPKKFDIQFSNYLSAVNSIVSQLKEKVTLAQKPERYSVQQGDDTILRLKKAGKKFGFGISKTFKFLSSNKSNPFVWHHEVNLRDIAKFYWKEHLSQRLITLLNPMQRAMNKSTQDMWAVDKKMDDIIQQASIVKEKESLLAYTSTQYNQGKERIRKERELIQKKARIIIQKNFVDYEQSLEKAGTIELSNAVFDHDLLSRKHEVLTKSLLRLEKDWANTSMVLRDDWFLDLELQLLQNVAYVENNGAIKQLQQRVKNKIFPKLDEINQFYDEQHAALSSTSGYEKLKEGLIASNRAFKSTFNGKLVQDTNLAIVRSEFPKVINDLEQKLDKAIRNISEETTVCNNESYDLPIKSSEVTTTSIQELLRFECWPEFQKKSKEIKAKLTEDITLLQSQLINLGQVEEFNLNVAIELLDEENQEGENQELKDPREIVLTGLQRSKDTIQEIKSKLNSLESSAEMELNKAIVEFNQRVEGLSEDDSIVALRMKITAQKAVEKSQKLREQTRESFRNFIPIAVQKAKEQYQVATQTVNTLKKKLGLMDEPEIMDLKLSDFLTTAEQSYNTLPFIYKRLFRNEPLNEETYYVGRSSEQENLKTALSRFQNGHFSASIIVGEKGAGVTSMINQFTKKIPSSFSIIRLEVSDSVHKIEDLYKDLSETLGVELKNLEELSKHLNSLPKTAFIVENIHLMFLKKIHGFEVLKELTEVISLTSSKIFWVMSCFSYSYDFLCKTIQLSEHFRYEIRMQILDESTMNKIIKDRHMVSGYNLSFQPSFRDMKSKKYSNLSDADAQVFLENQYFTALNKLSMGNISLALAYWLSSTKEVTGNKLMISPIPQFDLTFLRNLNENSLFTLSSLIMHDKLNIESLADVMNSDVNKVRRSMQTMMEYGLVKLSNGYYYINPLLYRHCLTILKSKNIIH